MRFLRERRSSPSTVTEARTQIPLWLQRIEQAHGYLVADIASLEGVQPRSQEELELSWRIATRVGNFTRAILNAHGVGLGVNWNEPGAIGINGDIPPYIQIQDHDDGSRTYYAPLRNEVSVVTVLKRDMFGRRVFNFGGREVISAELWGRNERIRGRVINRMRGILPAEVRDRLPDFNQGIKRG